MSGLSGVSVHCAGYSDVVVGGQFRNFGKGRGLSGAKEVGSRPARLRCVV